MRSVAESGDSTAVLVREIIDQYLERSRDIDPELEQYALLCREGDAQ